MNTDVMIKILNQTPIINSFIRVDPCLSVVKILFLTALGTGVGFLGKNGNNGIDEIW